MFQNEMLSLRESISELKSSKLKLESQLNHAEKNLGIETQKVDELNNNISQVSCSLYTFFAV